MFPAENLRDWRGKKVLDPESDKIGELEAIYVDTATDEPSFMTIKVGFIGRYRLAFVPLTGATVTPYAVRVRYAKKLVHNAPSIDTEPLSVVDWSCGPVVFGVEQDEGGRGDRADPPRTEADPTQSLERGLEQ